MFIICSTGSIPARKKEHTAASSLVALFTLTTLAELAIEPPTSEEYSCHPTGIVRDKGEFIGDEEPNCQVKNTPYKKPVERTYTLHFVCDDIY